MSYLCICFWKSTSQVFTSRYVPVPIVSIYYQCSFYKILNSWSSPLAILHTCDCSVADRDPHSYVFEPPGSASGYVRHKNGSGSSSGSFHPRKKIVGQILISTVLRLLCDFFFWYKCASVTDRIRMRIRMFLSLPDPHPDPYQNVTEHCMWVITLLYSVTHTLC